MEEILAFAVCISLRKFWVSIYGSPPVLIFQYKSIEEKAKNFIMCFCALLILPAKDKSIIKCWLCWVFSRKKSNYRTWRSEVRTKVTKPIRKRRIFPHWLTSTVSIKCYPDLLEQIASLLVFHNSESIHCINLNFFHWLSIHSIQRSLVNHLHLEICTGHYRHA